jgi:hypothetical protein
MKEGTDLDAKTVNFIRELGLINGNLKPSLFPRYTGIQIYKIFIRPKLSYHNESRTIRTAN